MTYVDGFVIPLPKKNLAAYKRDARLASKIWRDHGALAYVECVADDLAPRVGSQKPAPTFPKMTKLKRGETIVFAWITYRSRAHRDRVNANVMKDPRMAKMAMVEKPLFPMDRFAHAGFKAVIEA